MSKPIKKAEEKAFDEVDERIVRDFFLVWGEAVRKKDKATLERIIADDYSFVSPRGSFHDKAAMVTCVVEPLEPIEPLSPDTPFEPYTPSSPDQTPTESIKQAARPSGTSLWFLEPQFDIFRVVEEKLQSFGRTAMKTGKIVVQGVHHGRNVTGEYLFSNVFVKQNKDWQIVATHITRLPSETGA
jgi:ketosteroid isomerase-like protein